MDYFLNLPLGNIDENYNSFTVSLLFLLIMIYTVSFARFLGST